MAPRGQDGGDPGCGPENPRKASWGINAKRPFGCGQAFDELRRHFHAGFDAGDGDDGAKGKGGGRKGREDFLPWRHVGQGTFCCVDGKRATVSRGPAPCLDPFQPKRDGFCPRLPKGDGFHISPLKTRTRPSSSSMASARGRWKLLRPMMKPLPPPSRMARASLRTPLASLVAPPEKMTMRRPD